MKVNNIQFIKGQGGSGRTAQGTDYISALMFYNNTRPAALLNSLPGQTDNFSTGSVVEVFSASDAAALGIDDSYSDETQAQGLIEVTGAGSAGDTVTVKFQEWVGGSGAGLLTLGSYTVLSGDGVNDIAAGLDAAINALTNVHGYSSQLSGAEILITVRKGLGIFPNVGTPLQTVIVGTVTTAITQSGSITPGVASKLAVYYYHISRYFAAKPDGALYIGIFDTAGSSTFSDIANIVSYSNATVVQLGIWDDTQTFDLTSLTQIQVVTIGLEVSHKYLSSVVYAADIKDLSTPLATLAGGAYNLATLNAFKVSALIDNDGGAKGFDLFQASGISITSLGACIGMISESAVSENMGNIIQRFNTDDGNEFDKLMFGDGSMYNAVSSSLIDQLNTNRYLFLSKVAGTSGSWYNDNHTACPLTSDYAYINDNRIIDRVIKDLFPVIVPFLKAKLKLQTDGKMTVQQIAAISAACEIPIMALIASTDLAGDADNFKASDWIVINPNQKPKVTGKLVVAIKLYENAIAHEIEVPIGFA